MNQVAQTAENCVSHAAIHNQGNITARKRPQKSLRTTSGYTGNLVVFSHLLPRIPNSTPIPTAQAEPALPEQNASAAPATISQQVLASRAANHDQRYLSAGETLPAATLVNPGFRSSTFVKAFAGLVVVAMGVTWVATKSASPEPAIHEPVVRDQVSGNTDVLQPVVTPYARPEEDYLEELDWLEDQNRFLQAEVEMLTNETLELNRELLDLELQLATESQMVKPSTEKRIVYNFVDVPLGTELNDTPQRTESENNDLPHLVDKVLSYDPDTGFHLNGQFNEASDAPAGDIVNGNASEQTRAAEKLSYPPIEPSR